MFVLSGRSGLALAFSMVSMPVECEITLNRISGEFERHLNHQEHGEEFIGTQMAHQVFFLRIKLMKKSGQLRHHLTAFRDLVH